MSYSAPPGSIPSSDDWYLLDDNKVVTETTLIASNVTFFEWIHYDSVPYWIRVNVANLGFSTQQQWADLYFNNRSGTYNNQWILIDFNNYNQYKNNMSAAVDIIWFVEEFYSLTSIEDVTQALLVPQGYVASYNVPYNTTLLLWSENPTNYTNDTRALLFDKYAPGIQTAEEFLYVMRLNNFTDTGDYCAAIAARCDLASNTSFPFGAIDCKATSDYMVGNHEAWLIAGPTSELTPPFNWQNWPQFSEQSLGMPALYNFSWVYFDPNTNFSMSTMDEYKIFA